MPIIRRIALNKELLKKTNVLYVEDEKSVRDFTGKTIASIVQNIVIVNNGQEGLEAFKKAYGTPEAFDLVITDINMPKMNGLDMSIEIKKIDPEILIIITSAHNDADFLKKAIDIGIASYTLKPIDLYQLIEEMSKSIEPLAFKKELLNKNMELKNNIKVLDKDSKDKIMTFFNAQDSMIVSGDGTKTTECNDKFLNFFGVSSLEEFIEKYKCICHLIKTDQTLLHKFDNDLNWIQYFLKLPHEDRVIQLPNHEGVYKYFQIYINSYGVNSENFVISFADITKLKEKSKLYEYQASHDQLTNLYNNQKFEEVFKQELSRSIRYNHNLALMLIDIDNFNYFNETYDSNLADRVLRDVGKILTNCTREQDFTARLGADIFAILLAETTANNSIVVANKIQDQINNHKFKFCNDKITASFGLSCNKNSSEFQTIMDSAKKALQLSKDNGKNCINIYN
jgi:diguanylate cyclase (GGDEF)-like protein